MCIRWKPCALFVGVQDGEATVEKGFQVGQWEGICLPNAGDTGSIPGLGQSAGEGNGNYSCWENPMDRGAWRVTVHEVMKESDMTWRLNNNDQQLWKLI